MCDTKEVLPDLPALEHQFAQLREMASKDALSGVLNRGMAEQYINQRLASLEPESLCALLIIDLDNFKQVNDTLGHQAGDQAIRQSARILSDLFRATDIVGRLGGDEFLVFLSGQITEALVRQKAQEICQRLQLAVGGDANLTVTASVGVYLARGGFRRFEDLYRSADLALYKAKKRGKHGYVIKSGDGLTEIAGEEFQPVSAIPLSGLLEQMESGVALLEMGSLLQLLYVSPSFCRLIGVEPGAFPLPRLLSEIVHSDDFPELEQILQNALAKDIPAEHTCRVSADGQDWLWWHIRAFHLDYSNPNPVMLITTSNVSDFKRSETQLREDNERLRSAVAQTSQGVWEVNLATGIFTLLQYSDSASSTEHPSGRFPDFLLERGWIHPRSVDSFRTFARELLSGLSQGYGNFMFQNQQTGCFGWATLSYRLLTGEGGEPRAVGIIERLPRSFSGQSGRTLSHNAVPAALAPYLMAAFHANLNQDSIQELWIEGKDLHGTSAAASCTAVLQRGLQSMFSADDRQTLSRYFDPAQLLELFKQGERWTALTYRMVDHGGVIRWVDQVVHLLEDPLSRDVYLFTCLIRADVRHQWERETGIQLSRDPITGLYDRSTTRAMAEFRLRRGGCAMAIIQLGGLPAQNAQENPASRRARCFVATALATTLGPHAFLGQYAHDMLLAFFPANHTQENLRQILQDAFSFVRLSLSEEEITASLRLIAAVVRIEDKHGDYRTLTAQCVRLCQMWRNAVMDTVVFSQCDGDPAWNELRRSDAGDEVSLHPAEDCALSEQEKDAALRCISAMLSAETLEDSLRSILHVLGTQYQADRVYVLALDENRHMVLMPYEWTSPCKPSIQTVVSGLPVERFPMLQRCIAEQKPIHLTRPRPLAEDGDGPWRFSIFPIWDDKRMTGFLCLENPRLSPADTALAATLAPHILGEQRRFQSRTQLSSDIPGALLRGMPNLRSYMNVIYSLNSDIYSTLGAVCLDVPGLSEINGRLGFEYGSKLLCFISKTLSDLFGGTLLFRTWDAEFVALCPDTTQQVFDGRCLRLRAALQRRYPKDIRVGTAWSDGIFTGKELVQEAREMMRCQRVDAVLDANGAAYQARQAEAVSPLQQFTVYFQPLVHMGTGALAGAEVLVRGLDASGQLIPPDRFIHSLEERGEIRDLDLFVLEQAFAQLNRWQEKGLEPCPIAVNMSRMTLFDTSTFASVLAICSRYPKLPLHLLELEITESAGSVGSHALTEIVDRFRQVGVRVALDDFGSQYANFSIFTHVKFDCVKLDRTLISDLTVNRRTQMLVRDLVEICHSTDMLCVAEGVETQAQREALLKAGCNYGQGYYFSRPVSAEHFETQFLHAIPAESGGATSKEATK